MSIIDRIERLKQADWIVNPTRSVFGPTAYLGEEQMAELMALIKLEVVTLGKNLVDEPLILGMRLVEVKQKDYLRIA